MEELDELMGDPIDNTTGAFLQDISTINLNGGNALTFDLHYNSMLETMKEKQALVGAMTTSNGLKTVATT